MQRPANWKEKENRAAMPPVLCTPVFCDEYHALSLQAQDSSCLDGAHVQTTQFSQVDSRGEMCLKTSSDGLSLQKGTSEQHFKRQESAVQTQRERYSDARQTHRCNVTVDSSVVMLFVGRHIFTEEYHVFSLQAQNASQQDGADVQMVNIRRSDSGLQRLVKKREVQLRRWIARKRTSLKKRAAHFHRIGISRTSLVHRTDAMLIVSSDQECTAQCKKIVKCHRDQWCVNAHGKPINAMTQQAKSACLFLASPGDHFSRYARGYPCSGGVLESFPIDFRSVSGRVQVLFWKASLFLPYRFPVCPVANMLYHFYRRTMVQSQEDARWSVNGD